MDRPLISVNLCVWKPAPRFFPQAVESILNQTFQDFELIIVEDPSEFDGRAMIRHLLDDPRIRYVKNETRTGLIAQRNQALELSRAKLVAVLDADDVAKSERLATQFAFLQENPETKVLGSWLEIINEEGQTIGLRKYPTTHGEIARVIRRYNPIAQPAVVFDKELALALGGYQGEPYTEDYDLWCRIFNSGARFANLPGALVRYRLHEAASKTRHLRHILRSTIKIKRRSFSKGWNLGDYLRLMAEYGLLLIPPGLVYWLFRTMTFQKADHSRVRKS